MRFTKYITVLIILLAFSQCKKEHRYPDDPKKSRKTPNERLKGSWYIEEYTEDGVSVLDSMNKICNCDLKIDVIVTYGSIKDNDNKEFWTFFIGGKYFGYQSRQAFQDYHYLEIGPYDGVRIEVFSKLFITPFYFYPNAIARWNVTKLYKDEFCLELKSNMRAFRLKLIKQGD
jgi:hypothetical protein